MLRMTVRVDISTRSPATQEDPAAEAARLLGLAQSTVSLIRIDVDESFRARTLPLVDSTGATVGRIVAMLERESTDA